jgi:hypothetical protein
MTKFTHKLLHCDRLSVIRNGISREIPVSVMVLFPLSVISHGPPYQSDSIFSGDFLTPEVERLTAALHNLAEHACNAGQELFGAA